MKEMTSFNDDVDKRMGIFFGLGAFMVSTLFSFVQGLPPEAFLLRGVVVLTLFSLFGWAFGAWLKGTLEATKPVEELPSNVERRSRNAESLDEGTVVMAGMPETVVMEAVDEPTMGQAVNFTLPELTPMDLEPASSSAAPTMIPSAAQATAQSASAMPALVDDGDLPPPGVPAWLK